MQFLHNYDTIGDIVLDEGEDSCGNSECIPSGDGSLEALHIPVLTEGSSQPLSTARSISSNSSNLQSISAADARTSRYYIY